MNMYEVYAKLNECVPMVLLAESGSRAYGTHRPDSDHDYKGVYMLPAAEMLSLGGGSQTHALSDIDATAYELLHFCKLAANANPTVLETLWADNWMSQTTLGSLLRENRDLFLSKRVAKTYGGYAMAQVKKAKEGTGGSRGQSHHKRHKFKLHTLRLLVAGCHALEYGEVLVRLNSILTSTLNTHAEAEMEEFERYAEMLLMDLNQAAETSDLPDAPDVAAINKLMQEMRGI
jgi:predicted nucleotidyltransferase